MAEILKNPQRSRPPSLEKTLTGAVHGLPAGNISGLSTNGLPTHGLSAAHHGAHDLHAHSIGPMAEL